MNVSTAPTVAETVQSVHDEFVDAGLSFGHGADNPWDEAAWLVAWAIDAPGRDLSTISQQYLSDNEIVKISNIVQRRCQERAPLAYLIEEAWFCGMPFYVDQRVLVPRSYFSEWIPEGFLPWIDMQSINNALDLCTGSACIAIALAKYFPHCQIDAGDISTTALEVAKINAQRHQVEPRLTLWHSDLFSALPQKRYDLIVSNPPYVTESLMQDLPTEYRLEPELALLAADDGTAIIQKILQQSANYLNEKGHLIIESASASQAIATRFPTLPFTWLSTENGEMPLLLISREQLLDHHQVLSGK